VASRQKLGRGLLGQCQVQLTQEQFVLPVRLGVARQHQMAPVGGRHMNVDHLQSGKLVEDGTWGEAGRLWSGEILQGYEQAIGDERDEDVRLDARFELVEDGADGKIVLQLLERLLHLPVSQPTKS